MSGKAKHPFLLRFGISFLATLLICGGGLLALYHYVFSDMERENSMTHEQAGITQADYFDKNIVNIALFGIDTTDSSMVGRSDSVIVLTLDNKRKEIRMSAIQRDSYVSVEGHGKTKLNHAYAYGGAELAVKTLNQNFGLDITDYVVINFTNMEKVIDAIGGVELDVTEAYRKEANKHIYWLAVERGLEPQYIEQTGYQTLNGMQALGVLRARHNVGGTGARSEMHEIILKACYDKVRGKSAAQYPAIARSLLGLVKTTLTSGDVVNIGSKVLISGYQIRQAVFPLEADQPGGSGGRMIGGVWYLTFDEETAPQRLRDFVYNGELYGE